MSEIQYRIQASLAPCPKCAWPLVIVDGKPTTTITYWWKEGVPRMTPHREDCVFRGKELTPSMYPGGKTDA